MKFGVQSWFWTTRFTKEDLCVFDEAKELGFEGIEIDLGNPEALPIEGIKRKMDQTGLECTFSLGLKEEQSLIASSPKKRKAGIEFLKKLIKIISELEGDVLCGVLYAGWGELKDRMRTKKEWERAKKGLLEAGDFAKEHDVVLALEPVNRFEGYFLNTTEDALNLVREIDHPHVKIQLDTFQMNIEENSLSQAIETAGDDLYHIHLCENHRGIPGTGHIPWENVFKSLKEIGYDKWGVIEAWIPNVFLSEKGKIPRRIAMWREITPDGRIAAKKGIDFLKKIEKKIHN